MWLNKNHKANPRGMGFVPLMSEIEAPNRKPLNFLSLYTLPEINIAPENGWLEYDRFLFGMAYFQGRTVSFREGLSLVWNSLTLLISGWVTVGWWFRRYDFSFVTPRFVFFSALKAPPFFGWDPSIGCSPITSTATETAKVCLNTHLKH